MPSGTVRWFNIQKGCGYIGPDDGDEDIFVHLSAVLEAGLTELREGQAVEFEIELAKGGNTAATNLKLRRDGQSVLRDDRRKHKRAPKP